MVASTKMLPNQTGRRRVQHRFDLNLDKKDEYQLHEIIRSLKKKRSFLGVVRDGIRLVLDLRQGQTDVLCELFPWVFEQATPVSERDAILRSQFEELKLLICQRAAVPAPQPTPQITDSNALVIKEKTISEDFNPTWSLTIKLTSMAGNFAGLTPEMIWYGIRKGLINVQSALDDKLLTYETIAQGVKAGKVNKDKLPKTTAKEVGKLLSMGAPKKIASSSIELSEPNFDGIEVDL